jgi:hypothetical protein
VAAGRQVCESERMEEDARELGGVDWTDKKGRINETCPGSMKG